jgi:phosphoglycerate dehydrogenase-like enzyme
MESRPPKLLLALGALEIREFFPEPSLRELKKVTPLAEHVDSDDLDSESFHQILAEHNPEILLACWKTPPLPERLPTNLRYLCYLAGSVKKKIRREHLERGLIVTNWGDSIARTVAECALMLTLLSLRRGAHWIPVLKRDGAWRTGPTETASLFHRRVGLHGFGAVAHEFIRLVAPFGVRVEVCAPETDAALYKMVGVTFQPSLPRLFDTNDVIIELAPLNDQTRGIIDEKLLGSIRPGGVFVNVARGGLVDEEALVRVARKGEIQVGLDVFAEEPLPSESPLRVLPNVVLLPHLAGPTSDRCRDSGDFALRNLRAYLAHEPLRGEVTLEIFDRSS